MVELRDFVIDFMRVDSDDIDSIMLDIYIQSAIEYLDNAGVRESNKVKYLYKIAIALLSSHWYDNGTVTTDVNNTPLKYSLQYIVQQLKYCGE